MFEEKREETIDVYPFYRRKKKWLEETVYTIVRCTGVMSTQLE